MLQIYRKLDRQKVTPRRFFIGDIGSVGLRCPDLIAAGHCDLQHAAADGTGAHQCPTAPEGYAGGMGWG